MSIKRYDTEKIATTRFFALDELCNLVSGLRSIGYISDLMNRLHGFHHSKEIKLNARTIKTHTENALNLLNQAFSGQMHVSYLPLYYSFLNLAKVYIILGGKRGLLESQRHHGATYKPSKRYSTDFINEKIYIGQYGSIPLFYKTLTGRDFPSQKTAIIMKYVYPFIRMVSNEYGMIYGYKERFTVIIIDMEGNDTTGYRLIAQVNPNITKTPLIAKNSLKILSGFSSDTTRQNTFYTKYIKNSYDKSLETLKLNLRRYLLYCTCDSTRSVFNLTPISNSRIHLPEEFPILIAFFHLSNVVRYHPDYLDKLMGSKAWSLLLAMPKNCAVTFLELFCSYVLKTTMSVITY